MKNVHVHVRTWRYMYAHEALWIFSSTIFFLATLQKEANVGFHYRLSELESDRAHTRQERDAIRRQLESTCHELSVAHATLKQMQVHVHVHIHLCVHVLCIHTGLAMCFLWSTYTRKLTTLLIHQTGFEPHVHVYCTCICTGAAWLLVYILGNTNNIAW